ncbi:MAG TPA: Ca2+-dependent phosphoinositide-specific phospholipase C [Cellvibrio sp.]|nr:Ca2+-dependent phosphoinositide-specific phospholipase C [Cellvibrio sp.]
MTAVILLLMRPAFAQDAHQSVLQRKSIITDTATLRMNDIQVVGSHNSFKARMSDAVMAKLRATNPKQAESLDYYHVPLTEQLEVGVRQFELDIFADPQGGRYADPTGEALARAAGETTNFDRAAMLKPGFKVLHNPDVDYLSTCPTLIRCLSEIDRWSRAHPEHLPIMITLNAADTPAGRSDITDPLPLDNKALLDALDAEIRSALPGERLITPDDVRGDALTLREAIRKRGWPSLSTARGRIYILFDVRQAVSNVYRADHPSLAGRAMFGWYPDDEPESVVQIVQDPLVDGEKIKRWVNEGIIVRTRTDAGTQEARRKDFSKAKAAVSSGAQAVSTDYYPGAPDPLKFGFVITLQNGAMAQCNPVRITAGCPLQP